MHLSLTRDRDGKSGFVHVQASDLLYLEYDSMESRIHFHTLNEVFYAMGTLKYFQEALNNSGYEFEKVDRNYVVNTVKVVSVDRSNGYLYFEHPYTKHSKRCTVALSNLRPILSNIMKLNPSLIVQ